jgi:ATP-dependent helicase/nuclease subunit A
MTSSSPDKLCRRDSSEVDAAIASRLTYIYPYEADVHQKSKYSVSELNKDAYSSDDPARLFLEGSEDEEREDDGTAITAAERGTALHKAFEKLDYAGALAHKDDVRYFDDYLDGLVQGGFFNAEQRASVSSETIMRYAQTPLFARAARSDAAGGMRRETPFNYRMEHEGRPVIVQGIIDCFFEEDGAYVLIDFKSGMSDRGDSASDAYFTKVYGRQIDIYRSALSDISEKPVKEAALYLMSSGRVLPVSG